MGLQSFVRENDDLKLNSFGYVGLQIWLVRENDDFKLIYVGLQILVSARDRRPQANFVGLQIWCKFGKCKLGD